ncbi:MAG: hypothetical protein KatS3mg062_0346 [Tepidiforma sp.]|nr:MAG: hypothetical protein KatS3mg062_0346 [Tepidiforma sp.]
MPRDGRVKAWLVPAASLLGAGWFFATALIVGVVIGRWADGKTGLEPTFTLIGAVFGLAVALYGGYRMLQPLMNGLGDEPPE